MGSYFSCFQITPLVIHFHHLSKINADYVLIIQNIHFLLYTQSTYKKEIGGLSSLIFCCVFFCEEYHIVCQTIALRMTEFGLERTLFYDEM